MRIGANQTCAFYQWDEEECELKIKSCKDCEHYIEAGTKSAAEIEKLRKEWGL